MSLREADNDVSEIDFKCQYWRPSWCQPLPQGLWAPKFLIWFLFDRLRVFKSNGYGVLLIYRDRQVIHRSCVFPRFFRFPFMTVGDLQIGDVWTEPNARGEGCATLALKRICNIHAGTDVALWYLVDEKNASSISVVEKVGFKLVGIGRKYPRIGTRIIGYYAIKEFEPKAQNYTNKQ